MTGPLGAVLFDLDGTLVDSAPDLAGACNEMRIERGLAPLPYEQLRRMVGSGARGMVGVSFGLVPDSPGYAELRDEFLDRYEARMTRETKVFDAMVPVLAWLEREGLPWGIVTNKATRFAAPLVASLGLATRAATLVCGDTVAHAKPHPAPLLEAARRLGLAPRSLRLRRRRSARRRRRPRRRDAHGRRSLGLPGRGRRAGGLGCRPPDRAAGRAAGADRRRLKPGRCPKLGTLGLTWLRRGFGVGTVHAEHQFARKSTGNKVTANDTSYALAA